MTRALLFLLSLGALIWLLAFWKVAELVGEVDWVRLA